MAKDIKKDIDAVKKTVKKVVTSEETKKAVKNVVDTTENAVQTAVETATQVVKKISNKEVKPTVFIQYDCHEAEISSIRDKVIADFVEQGHSLDEITDMKIYAKPQEATAYYVINEGIQGKVQLW